MTTSATSLTRPGDAPGGMGTQPTRIQFRDGERAFFVGHTGSGKTTLATRFITEVIPRRLPVVVIDPKHLYPHEDWQPPRLLGGRDPQGWELVDKLPRDWARQVRREKRPRHLRLIVRPAFMEDQRKNAALNDLYERIFEEGLALIYLDEIQALVKRDLAAPQLSQLVQMGRAKRISVWGSTLRPSSIPRMFLSESDHIFAFRLRDDADRDRIAEVIGAQGKVSPGPGPFDFWYRSPGVEYEHPVLVHQS